MKPDDDFYLHLQGLSNGSRRQQTYKAYKLAADNYCYTLNGALRAGFDLNKYLHMLQNMNDIILAKNKDEVILYRMTSDIEFTPSGALVANNEKFRYPAFLSTTREINCLYKFLPSKGFIPAVLEILCPSGTAMALMEEGNSTSAVNENEILLGANTEFKIVNSKKLTDNNDISKYVSNQNINEMYCLSIEVVDNPVSSQSVNSADFFCFQ